MRLIARNWAKSFPVGKAVARFTLPLSPPANPLPPEKSFGVKRIFNGKPAPQPHTGVDYPTPVGSPVLAVADGTIVMAEEMFFEGNAVFIDHGDGLVSMYFHLAEIKVAAGEDVKRGQILGRVGSTGRATGPHLFFGVRWHDVRIDPWFVLEKPERIPEIQVLIRSGRQKLRPPSRPCAITTRGVAADDIRGPPTPMLWSHSVSTAPVGGSKKQTIPPEAYLRVHWLACARPLFH
jgi:murein DD-endopeptidase MepM/ murein hydrolase activator NlpD